MKSALSQVSIMLSCRVSWGLAPGLGKGAKESVRMHCPMESALSYLSIIPSCMV